MAIPWLYSVGFSVTFGTLFAKILRVYRLFASQSPTDHVERQGFRRSISKSSHSSSSTPSGGDIRGTGSRHHQGRRTLLTFRETLAVIGAVLLVDVTILLVWTLADPLHWERKLLMVDQFGSPLVSHGYCTSNHWRLFSVLIGTFHVGLMGTACFLCYKARSIPSRFSEHKFLGIAMISNLQIFLVGLPILIILGSDPISEFFVRSVVIWMVSGAVYVWAIAKEFLEALTLRFIE